ncbi:hypothetical protein MMC13_003497 [Lambiella insularis]|nr:hypothetical protein [Lambiella insularis]
MSLLLRDSPFASPVPNNTGYIDLTADSSPPVAPASMPRMRSTSNVDEPARKRRRVNEPSGPSIRSLLGPFLNDVERVDLTKVDDDTGLKKLQEEQRVRHDRQIQQQQELQQSKQQEESIRSLHEQSRKPTRISDLQCVVCMDNMTNITATHCGHLFCHTCIMEALIAGESQGPDPGKGPSRCPVCRKKVVRPKEGKEMQQVIPLELKLLTKSAVAKGKEKAKDRSQ